MKMKTNKLVLENSNVNQQFVSQERQNFQSNGTNNGNSNRAVVSKPPLDKKQLAKLEKDRAKAAKKLKKGKILCQACKKKCTGEVLRVQDKYFHNECFKCRVCHNSLAKGGFFTKDGAYYCTTDYQRNFGTRCAACNDYVEGELVVALGQTYHQQCFTCGRCRQPFPSGEQVTSTGKEVLCQKCVQIPYRNEAPAEILAPVASTPKSTNGANDCAGCGKELTEGQTLVALDQQWHVWCFQCRTCGAVLHGEYMGREGKPYCERDYQRQFGVKCAYCNRYISGKVLQAGDNHHFHPTCARCTKCGDPFGDGEEMYLQGGAIWHPRCGPGPNENGQILNGTAGGGVMAASSGGGGHHPPATTNGHCTDTDVSTRELDRMSSSGVSELQHYSYRTPSPGLILRDHSKSGTLVDNISRIYTYSYLTEEPTMGYLRRPIDPYDKIPTSPHFHRPTSQNSLRGSSSYGGGGRHSTTSRSGMRVLVDSIRSETPRSKSPHMNNEEPIELAHFPAAKPPQPGEPLKIERDDFPAPPYPYTDPERRKRLSAKADVEDEEDEDENDGDGGDLSLEGQQSSRTRKTAMHLNNSEVIIMEDEKLKREEEELSKIASGIGKVFLKNVHEREKLRQWKAAHLDPRNASRTPSASKEPTYRLRYGNPIGASPSRNMDHPKLFEDDEFDRSYSCRSSVGRSIATIPNYNVSSLRNVPRPGYGLKASTLPTVGNGYGDYSFSGLGGKNHSTDFSSGKSDISVGSITDVERRALASEIPTPGTYMGEPQSGVVRAPPLGRYPNECSSQVRRSLPNMAHSMLINEPAKIYPHHLLIITNYRLPVDVDRCNLERHLSDHEFQALFQMSRVDFYRVPQWRRNELKRRARLF